MLLVYIHNVHIHYGASIGYHNCLFAFDHGIIFFLIHYKTRVWFHNWWFAFNLFEYHELWCHNCLPYSTFWVNWPVCLSQEKL